MSRQYLSLFDLLSYKGRTGELRYYEDDIAVIKFKNGESVSLKHQELEEARSDGDLVLIRRTQYTPCHIKTNKNQDEQIIRFEAYCTALDQESAPSAKGAREKVISRVSFLIGDNNPPSISNIHKIYRRWISSGRNMVEALFGRQKHRSPSIPNEIFELMDSVIDSDYLKEKRPSAKKAYDCFTAAYRTRGYLTPCPSISSFQRRISSIDRIHVIRERYGKSAARQEERNVTAQTKFRHILEVAELDTAHFNVGLKNNSGQYVGMPSVYFVMDCYSRVILGYGVHIGKHSESSACVIHTLRYAISRKKDPLYPYFGLPSVLTVDQGAAYISKDSLRFFEGLMVDIVKTATRMGWGKPMVERFIGTARTRFFSSFDGYLGKRNSKIYSDKTVKSAAKHTVGEFRLEFSKFIINYHNTPHSGLNGKTPAQVWKESAKSNPPIVIDDIPYSQLLRGICEDKILKRGTGITCDYQNFNSDELKNLYHSLQKVQKPDAKPKIKITTYRDPLDAAAISVVNPQTNKLFEVPNVLGDNAHGLSFAELRVSMIAMTTAQASHVTTAQNAPTWDGGVRENYSSQKRRKGPDVPLDDFDNPLDLDTVLKSPAKGLQPSSDGYEDRPQIDEEDDYAITIE